MALLFFEQPEPDRPDYCHRRLAAEWLERELGIEVPELAGDEQPDLFDL